MRVLVTGGTGFIGAGLVRELLSAGYAVRVLDDDSRGRSARLGDVAADIDIRHADVRDREAVDRAVQGCEIVAHLAFINGTEYFYSKPELVLEVGVKGTVNVIDAAMTAGVEQFWFMSSSEVYQTPPTVPTDELVPLSIPDVLNPRYSYAGAKQIGELLTVNYGRTHFQRAVIVRPHNVYGPDMGSEHVIPQFINRLVGLTQRHRRDPISFPVQGDGSQTRAFVYVDDFCRGARLAFEKADSPGVVHIGTDDERRIADVAQIIAGEFGREITIVPGPEPAGATPRRCPDITLARSLGFHPAVSLEDGLRTTVAWYRARG